VTAAATGFLLQLNRLDHHAPIEGLAHIVDRQRRRRGGHERLHLDTRATLQAGDGADADLCSAQDQIDLDRIEGQAVAERDEFVGAFGRLDAGDARHRQDVSLGDRLSEDGADDGWSRRDHGAGGRAASGDRLATDIDHAGVAATIEMGESQRAHASTPMRV
jgi:hypothetical protein